jgi:hypothetical protein
VKLETIKRADNSEFHIAEGQAGDETGVINFRVSGDAA